MDFYHTIFRVIDTQSFSSLWYWIAVAVQWSATSYFVLGVPFDFVMRGQRHGGQAMQDLNDLTHIHINYRLLFMKDSGAMIISFTSTILSILLILGFFYGAELAQALFLMGFPMTIVALLGLKEAHRIHTNNLIDAELISRLKKHHFKTQIVGFLTLLVTSMWGMYLIVY